ncbi:MAG: uroporphyrinogen III methyltransferase/synthase [Verrucomicrobiales bacterium]|jgi:uroporphyrinogen III methyltransferase/synthase
MGKPHPIGKVYLVGAGPGDLGLITLKGRECIEIADVVVYDYLSNKQMLAWAKPEAKLIYAGKKAKYHTLSQKGINDLLVELAEEGNTVCRLKGGDPMIFGRGGEEAQELEQAGIPFEIVPGISSAIAGPIYAGIPVTHRDHCSMLTIFTGHEDPTKTESSIDYAKLAKLDGTKVMLMGVERVRSVTEQLLEHGMDANTPVGLVRWATTGAQESITGELNNIADKIEAANFKSPAVAVFGGVVTLRDQINWFEKKPLFGKRVVVTRTRKQAGELSKRLADLGADVFELPTIKIEPPKDMMSFGKLVQDAHTYDWLIFTSPNGVEAFCEMFYKLYTDAREIGGVRIAAIGPGTAAKLKEYRFATDLMPETSVAESLLETLEEGVGTLDNLKMLWVKAEVTREVLSQHLKKKGVILDEAIAYRTVAESNDNAGAIERFKDEGADVITFTSSSTVEHFLELKLPLPERLKIASIGPITSRTLKTHGLYVDVEAEKHDIPGLVNSVIELCAQKPPED